MQPAATVTPHGLAGRGVRKIYVTESPKCGGQDTLPIGGSKTQRRLPTNQTFVALGRLGNEPTACAAAEPMP